MDDDHTGDDTVARAGVVSCRSDGGESYEQARSSRSAEARRAGGGGGRLSRRHHPDRTNLPHRPGLRRGGREELRGQPEGAAANGCDPGWRRGGGARDRTALARPRRAAHPSELASRPARLRRAHHRLGLRRRRLRRAPGRAAQAWREDRRARARPGVGTGDVSVLAHQLQPVQPAVLVAPPGPLQKPARALRLSQPGGHDGRHRQRPGRHVADQLRRRHRGRGGGVPAGRVARGAPLEGAPAPLLRPGPAHAGPAADARGSLLAQAEDPPRHRRRSSTRRASGRRMPTPRPSPSPSRIVRTLRGYGSTAAWSAATARPAATWARSIRST